MAVSKDRQLKASNSLEELEPGLKEIISQLRSGVSDELAYALVYRLRREIGYVVAGLGEGAPTTAYDTLAGKIIDSQKQPK